MTVLEPEHAADFWARVPQGRYEEGKIHDLGTRLCDFAQRNALPEVVIEPVPQDEPEL